MPSGCCVVWLHSFFPTFRRNVSSKALRLRANSRTHNPEKKGGMLFRNVGNKLTHPHGVTARKTCFLSTGLQLTISFSATSFPVGKAAGFSHDLSCIFRYRLSRSRLLHKRSDVWLRQAPHALQVSERIGMTRLRNTAFCVCVRARMYASNGDVWQKILRKPSILGDALYKLYVPHTNTFLGKVTLTTFLSLLTEKESNFLHFSSMSEQY